MLFKEVAVKNLRRQKCQKTAVPEPFFEEK